MIKTRELTERDVSAFALLMKIKERSLCIDKQVACIIVDPEGFVVGTGENHVVRCDKNCHDKANRVCEVIHAEVVAVSNTSAYAKYNGIFQNRPLTTYCSLFPCAPCQRALLAAGITDIVSFGMIHKDVVADITVFPHIEYSLRSYNGDPRQLSVVQGELAELTTAISDNFFREDKPESKYLALVDEIIDAELQIEILKIILQEQHKDFYTDLRTDRFKKYSKLMKMIKGTL
jgi:deoxycytidylate deaminase